MYAGHLGGTATFSGLVIGIPTLVSGICLIPLVRIDEGELILAPLLQWLHSSICQEGTHGPCTFVARHVCLATCCMPQRTKPTGYTSSSSAVLSLGWVSLCLCTPNGTAQIPALLVYAGAPPWPDGSSQDRELASPWAHLLVGSCGSSCSFLSLWGLTVR